jgi:hypothetical protein
VGETSIIDENPLFRKIWSLEEQNILKEIIEAENSWRRQELSGRCASGHTWDMFGGF